MRFAKNNFFWKVFSVVQVSILGVTFYEPKRAPCDMSSTNVDNVRINKKEKKDFPPGLQCI